MWIIERIAFFTLIREKGAVYTIQAIYVSTPAAVLWAILIFGKPARSVDLGQPRDPHDRAVAQQQKGCAEIGMTASRLRAARRAVLDLGVFELARDRHIVVDDMRER